MALIKCTECGKDISDKAISCPHGGFVTDNALPLGMSKKQISKVSKDLQGLVKNLWPLLIKIPVVGIALFLSVVIVNDIFVAVFETKEKKEYYDCRSRMIDQAGKGEPLIRCERPAREWKWQPKED